ncbi:hypothetical protein ES703_80291 [subsurface metagenome]
MFIGDDGDDAAYDWKPDFFTNQIFSTLVCRVHCNGCIAKHRLRPGRGNSNILNALSCNLNLFDKWITQIPEMSLHHLVLDLIVGQHCLRSRVPIDQPFASIYESVLEKFEERSTNGFCADLIHSEPSSLPVARTAHRPQLFNNPGLVFVFPGLHAGDEVLACKVRSPLALLRQDTFLNDRLGGDAGVVGPGHPESIVFLHPAEPNQDILQCIIQRMSKVQRCRYVRRRDNDSVVLFLPAIAGGFSVKVLAGEPDFACLPLYRLWLINFRKLFAHNLPNQLPIKNSGQSIAAGMLF